MNITSGTRLSFVAEWYQEEAAIIRSFMLTYYPSYNAVEIYDTHSKKTFLRRTKMPEVSERDFYVGSKLNVFGRQFDIVDYADEFTKCALAKFRKKTFILIKHFIRNELGVVLCALIKSNFSISNGLMVTFTPEQSKLFLGESNKGDVETSVLMNQLLAGPSIGFELIGDNAVKIINSCITQSKEVKIPPPLEELFEREDIRNGIYCSRNDEDVAKNINFFFSPKNAHNVTCTLKNSTLAVIKPHCIKEGNLGKIILDIMSHGFKIDALRMHLLERVNCEEFYEVYRGILPEYIPMVAQLGSGVCMALEITCIDETKNSYEEFRKFCGPMDPEIAKLLRPDTLRAKFGVSKILNAIHCTDLPDDTTLEIQYMFKIVD